MIWEILLGIVGAILLLVLLSLAMSGLTGFYRRIFEARFKHRPDASELSITLARFAAVVTLTLCLGLVIFWRYVAGAEASRMFTVGNCQSQDCELTARVRCCSIDRLIQHRGLTRNR